MVHFKSQQILFEDTLAQMVFVKNMTWLAKYEQMKIDHQFYEMLTATVSHEMKTPLNVIITLLQDIGCHLHTAEEKIMLVLIQNSAEMLLYLVNDIMDLY